MQTATFEMESKSLDLSICVHHYTLRAPGPKGQGIYPSSRRENAVHYRNDHIEGDLTAETHCNLLSLILTHVRLPDP